MSGQGVQEVSLEEKAEALKARRYQPGIFQALLPDWGQDKRLGARVVGRAGNCGVEGGVTVGWGRGEGEDRVRTGAGQVQILTGSPWPSLEALLPP